MRTIHATWYIEQASDREIIGHGYGSGAGVGAFPTAISLCSFHGRVPCRTHSIGFYQLPDRFDILLGPYKIGRQCPENDITCWPIWVPSLIQYSYSDSFRYMYGRFANLSS